MPQAQLRAGSETRNRDLRGIQWRPAQFVFGNREVSGMVTKGIRLLWRTGVRLTLKPGSTGRRSVAASPPVKRRIAAKEPLDELRLN
jgi:hypothetical protein